MSGDKVDLFLDYLAYCFWREYRYNFWMIFEGKGQNGKSILLQLMERFLGKENVSGETLDRILNERFAVAQLYNKLLNVDADVSAEVVLNRTGIIKKLTGNDLHTAEVKYKTPWPFRNFAKLIFSCNKLPETDDLTTAFFRRLLIINFTRQFFGDKDDPYIIDKLSTEEEFSVLFNEILRRLPRVIKEGVVKVTDELMEETYDTYMRGSNSIKYFYNHGMECNVAGATIRKLALYEHYLKLCEHFRISPESDTLFSKTLTNELGLKAPTKSRDKEGQGYFWIGVRIKDWVKEERAEERARLEDLVKGNYFGQEVLEGFK